MASMWNRAAGIVEYARLFSDMKSVQEFRRVYNSRRPSGEASSLAKFRLRALRGNYAYCRTKGSDINVFSDTFRKNYHLPPQDLMGVRTILDLGSNIGLTMAHFACLFPRACVLGIELDAGNVELCRRNIAPYGNRCRVIWGAVWTASGQVNYGGDEEWGFRVIPDPSAERVVSAYTMCELLQQLGAPADYVKMDIEGAERALLKEAKPWINSVRCINIEIHEPYSITECVEDLKAVGFRAIVDSRHPACVIAYNTVAC